MRNKSLILILSLSLFSVCEIHAQDKPSYKFGKIEAADFNLPDLKFDSGASAVILSEIGSTRFEGNNDAGFTLVFTRYMRVRIIEKSGIDIGKFVLELYHDDAGLYEKLTSLKGSTFNQENGVIAETKLDDKSIFSERYSRAWERRKFSMPALKEGSVFDLEYTIKSPFKFQLRPWSFQGKYPRLWSEYSVNIAPPYHYVMKLQGDTTFEINTTKLVFSDFTFREENGAAQSEVFHKSGNSLQRHWAKKNVPSLHEESFITSMDNYNSRISFQLDYYQWSNSSERHDYLSNWTLTSKELLESEDFGLDLDRENGWMSNDLNNIVSGATSNPDKTYNIFRYIRDNFKSTGVGSSSLNHPLKDVFKMKSGSVAEINLLLVAMLKKAGITADPVLLSTRDNGVASTSYPLIDEYNYVVCVAFPDNAGVLLDASQPYNGYGSLPEYCYNGWAHVISINRPMPIELYADSLREANLTTVMIFNDDHDKTSGSYKNMMGKDESYDLREKIASTSLKEYEKKIQTDLGSDYVVGNLTIDSLKKYDYPVTVNYDFDLKNASSSDILYFNPMFGEGYHTNPFKSVDRHYPVEIPHLIDETYILNMDIPAGYQVEELPKSARVNYNESEGQFEYLIQKDNASIHMRVRLKLNKVFFPVDEYTTLKDFFTFIVKKESEQIVFKKIQK